MHFVLLFNSFCSGQSSTNETQLCCRSKNKCAGAVAEGTLLMRTLLFLQHPCSLQQKIVCKRQGQLLFSSLQDEGEAYPLARDTTRLLGGEVLCISISVSNKVFPQKMVLAISAAALEDDPEHLIGCK